MEEETLLDYVKDNPKAGGYLGVAAVGLGVEIASLVFNKGYATIGGFLLGIGGVILSLREANKTVINHDFHTDLTEN